MENIKTWTMYCRDCADEVQAEYFKDTEYKYVWYQCVECEGDDVVDVGYCESCEKPQDADELRDGICTECVINAKKDFSYELEHIFANNSSSYRKAVNLAYEGLDL